LPEQPFDPDDPPPRIGEYEVLSPLGGGGMAMVYLARGDNGRQVAVKLIRPELAADEGFRQRFEREATYARRVRQAYVAPVLDFGYHHGRPFLVTEYIEGPTLEQAVRERGPMPAHEVEQLGEQVALALVAIHAVGVVHRDLKPSNVILGRTGPRVIDFGIARALDDSGGLTSQNVRLGTPSYMAPEQFDDDAEAGKPADVFAWGGLLVFASTGRPPFGTASNLKEVDVLAHRIATREPNLDEFEEPLRTLVRAAMAKNSDRRPTARDLVRRLSTGDQPTPAGAAPSTEEPAPTQPGPAATVPVPAAAFTAPLPPRPDPGPPIARFRTDGGWPERNPADGAGVVMPAWTALLVRAGIALGVVIVLLLGWLLLLPEATRLLLEVGLGGAVVLLAVGVGIWRYHPEWWWLPLGGLVLLLAAVVFIYVMLTNRLWVSFDEDGQVAVLQGAGPHGVLGAENITRVEPFGTDRQELSRSPLLADALEDGIGVGDRAEGEQLAQCLPLVFTPTADTRAAAQEQCADTIADTPLQLLVRHHPIPGTTEHTPAVAATDDKVVVAWTDGNNYRLQAGRSRSGTDVEPLGPLGEEFESDQEPALATDGDRFFLAWRDQDEHVALASSTDGEDFGEPVVLDTTTTKAAPALAYGNGTLLLAWVDGNNQLHLWPAADADALQFVPEQELPPTMERSPAAPNLLFAEKNWYLTWAGTDRQVNIQTYTGDLRPLDKDTLSPAYPPSTECRPAIAVLDVFIVAWTRPDGLVGLLLAKSSEPNFVNQLALEVRSGTGVNMTTFQGHVLLTWAGDDQQPGGQILRLP
jgi:predicted Ser/Thr protein kinase